MRCTSSLHIDEEDSVRMRTVAVDGRPEPVLEAGPALIFASPAKLREIAGVIEQCLHERAEPDPPVVLPVARVGDVIDMGTHTVTITGIYDHAVTPRSLPCPECFGGMIGVGDVLRCLGCGHTEPVPESGHFLPAEAVAGPDGSTGEWPVYRVDDADLWESMASTYDGPRASWEG